MSGQSWCHRVRELHLSSKTDQELPVFCCWEQPYSDLWTGWRLLPDMNKKDGLFYRVLWLADAYLQCRWSLLPPAGNGHGTKVNRLKGIGGTSEMLLFPQFCPAPSGSRLTACSCPPSCWGEFPLLPAPPLTWAVASFHSSLNYLPTSKCAPCFRNQ